MHKEQEVPQLQKKFRGETFDTQLNNARTCPLTKFSSSL